MEDRAAADAIRSVCNGKDAAVREIKRQDKNTAPPKLYDLTTLQREANRLFGYTAQQTLDYTQSLYEKKLCTYPRTDSRFLTEHGGSARPEPRRTAFLPAVFCWSMRSGLNNGKVSDHHAIIPRPQWQRKSGFRRAEHPTSEAARLLCAKKAETASRGVRWHLPRQGSTVLAESGTALGPHLRKPRMADDILTELPRPGLSSAAASVREGFPSRRRSTLLRTTCPRGVSRPTTPRRRRAQRLARHPRRIIEKLVRLCGAQQTAFPRKRANPLPYCPTSISPAHRRWHSGRLSAGSCDDSEGTP